MRAERRTRGLFAAAFVLLSAQPAAAYCRTVALPDPPLVDGCPSQGLPVYWPRQCVGYRLHQDASAQLPQLASLVARAFARWTNPGDDACLPSLIVVPLMPTPRGEVGYDPDGPNSNLIVFRTEAWPWDPAELEHTTLTYVLNTGEILDADLEVNAFDPTGEGAFVESELERILTHGAGHFLGFAHADAPSVMEEVFEPGDSHELSSDDVQGMCDAYPENGQRLVRDASGNDVWMFARTCSFTETDGACGPLDVGHGCSVTRTPLVGAGWTVPGLGVLAGAAALRRRRRRRLR